MSSVGTQRMTALGSKATVGQACLADLIHRRGGPARLHKLQPVIQLRHRRGHVLSAPPKAP